MQPPLHVSVMYCNSASSHSQRIADEPRHRIRMPRVLSERPRHDVKQEEPWNDAKPLITTGHASVRESAWVQMDGQVLDQKRGKGKRGTVALPRSSKPWQGAKKLNTSGHASIRESAWQQLDGQVLEQKGRPKVTRDFEGGLRSYAPQSAPSPPSSARRSTPRMTPKTERLVRRGRAAVQRDSPPEWHSSNKAVWPLQYLSKSQRQPEWVQV